MDERENTMTMEKRRVTRSAEKNEIERAIEGLYAAGLELQSGSDRVDVAPCLTAIVPGCLQRIADLMTDLRKVADCSSRGERS